LPRRLVVFRETKKKRTGITSRPIPSAGNRPIVILLDEANPFDKILDIAFGCVARGACVRAHPSRLQDQRTVSASIHTQIMFKTRINHLAKQKRRGARFSSNVPQNLIEKIAQRYSVDLSPGQVVLQGDFVSISPDKVMTHDNTGAVMQKYAFLGVSVGG
jgi:hypothetical protein